MQKARIDATVDLDIYNIVRIKYPRQVSGLINNFLRSLIDFENPEEEKLREEIKSIDKQILSLRSEKATKETLLESLQRQKDKEAEDQEKERLQRARMINNSIKASGVLRDWGQD